VNASASTNIARAPAADEEHARGLEATRRSLAQAMQERRRRSPVDSFIVLCESAQVSGVSGYTRRMIEAGTFRGPRRDRAIRLLCAGLVSALLMLCCCTQTDVSSAAGRMSPDSLLVVNRYSISFAIATSQQGTDANGSAGNTVWSDALQWSASWPDVSIDVFYTAPGVVHSVGGFASGGTVQASENFVYNDPSDIYQPTNCMGNLPTQTYSDGEVSMTTDSSGFFEALSPSATKFTQATNSVVQVMCTPDAFKVNTNPDSLPFTLPDGVKFEEFGVLGLDWSTATPGVDGVPTTDIIAGRSFAINSGKQTQATSDGSVTEAVNISFKFLGSASGGAPGRSSVCRVPTLKGRTLTAAGRALKAAGCNLGKVTTPSPRPHGTLRVVAQTPHAGITRPYGSRVSVTLG